MKIDPSVLDFLTRLNENNNRDWFHLNKEEFEKSKSIVENFVFTLIAGIKTFDPQIGLLTPKDCMFRIYRDVRFSKDKLPYKTNFGGYIVKDGKSGNYAGYYLHIQPGQSFLAGGIYQPSPEVLKKVRQEIAFNLNEFKELLFDITFKKYFKEITGEKLVRMPKEYARDFGEEELLKFKSYVVMHEVPDKLLLSDGFYPHCLEVFKAMMPVNHFFNHAID